MTTVFAPLLNALPADGFGAFLLAMGAKGMAASDVDRMAKENPARLLGLDRQGDARPH